MFDVTPRPSPQTRKTHFVNGVACYTIFCENETRSPRGRGFAPPSADGSPAGRLFEKSPLHPAKTFTLAAKAEGQVVDLPLAGVSVIRVTPSSPKRLYLPLRANLHRQVWGLDSVPAPYGEATSAFWSGGGAGGTPCKKPSSSRYQRRRFLPYNGKATPGG